ncbi:hypothetical protein [Agromyces sp. M3QZ16-3]|uniref:hypothetical protein n=1 Tax=Agromyces sp. M3QZ16-3 TaxID=3447585 RepID=UPI003F68E074
MSTHSHPADAPMHGGENAVAAEAMVDTQPTDDASVRPAPESSGPGAFEPFAVDHILVTELPSSLGTVDAPERYTVTAVFTRRPLPQELELLGAQSVDARLTEAGYPRVALRAADRRLLISNTNLNELQHGLAREIGRILDEIGHTVSATRSAQARDAAELASRAAERASRVLAEAERVDFSPHRSMYT